MTGKYDNELKILRKKKLRVQITFVTIFIAFAFLSWKDNLGLIEYVPAIIFIASFLVYTIVLAHGLISYCPKCGHFFFGINIQRKSCQNCGLSLLDK